MHSHSSSLRTYTTAAALTRTVFGDIAIHHGQYNKENLQHAFIYCIEQMHTKFIEKE
jgi:hypothetical protein